MGIAGDQDASEVSGIQCAGYENFHIFLFFNAFLLTVLWIKNCFQHTLLPTEGTIKLKPVHKKTNANGNRLIISAKPNVNNPAIV